jgi:hypothetical protein
MEIFQNTIIAPPAGSGSGGANITLSNVDPATGRASLGAAGLDSVTGTLQPAQAPGSLPAVSGSLPTAMTLSLAAEVRERPFDLLPERFVTADQKFEALLPTEAFYRVAAGGGAIPTITANGLTLANGFGFGQISGATFISPCICVQSWWQTPPGSGTRVMATGIADRTGSPMNRGVWVYYDAGSSTVGLECRIGGVQTLIAGTASFTATGPFGFAVLFYNNHVCVFADTGAGWRFIRGWDNISATLNLRQPANLANMCPTVYGSSTTPWSCTRIRAGYAGHTGLQNGYAMKYEDGEVIYDERGRYFLQSTAVLPSSVANLDSTGWDFSHTAVWAVDPITFAMEPVSKIFLQRGGLHVNDDISGVIYYDRALAEWKVCMQNSSQLGVVDAAVFVWSTKENLLSGVHSLSNVSASPLVLPAPFGTWDLDLLWVPSESTWYAVYAYRTASISGGSFFPRLAKGPTLASLTQVGEDLSNTNAEGLRFVKIGGVWYVASYSGVGIRLYSLTSFSTVRTFSVTAFSSPSAPHSHANIIPVRIGSQTRYILDTMDGARDHGNGSATYGSRVVAVSPYYAGSELPLSVMPPRT